jgi:carboxymethylenebutenolidase
MRAFNPAWVERLLTNSAQYASLLRPTFAGKDAFIQPGHVDTIREKHADLPLYAYPPGHGFNCEQRADYYEESAALARSRTLAFLREHVG